MDGVSGRPGNGPATPAAYSGPFISGMAFTVTKGGCWFQGFWIWCCNSGQATTSVKCALWNQTGLGTGTLVPNSTVQSPGLTAGAWTYAPLPTPLQLTIGAAYVMAVGINGPFPDTGNQFRAGDPYAAGITNGPLTFFSSITNDGHGNPWSIISGSNGANGAFSTAGSDPALVFPNTDDQGSNFWIDAQISDAPPTGYTGSYRLYPNMMGPDPFTAVDSSVNYVLATEIRLTAQSSLNRCWFYSFPGSAQLPTSVDIWSVDAGGTTGTRVAGNTSPTWSGAGGSGWVSCPLTGSLPIGTYRLSVYNGAATPDGWSAKRLMYWTGSHVDGNGQSPAGVAGITAGPLYAPRSVDASICFSFNPATGNPTEPGQCSFATGPPNKFPNFYVGAQSLDGALFQNYWVDLEATPFTTVIGTLTATVGPITASAAASPWRIGTAVASFGPITASAAGQGINPGTVGVISLSAVRTGDVNSYEEGDLVPVTISVQDQDFNSVDPTTLTLSLYVNQSLIQIAYAGSVVPSADSIWRTAAGEYTAWLSSTGRTGIWFLQSSTTGAGEGTSNQDRVYVTAKLAMEV